jgi:hypothetical protein
VTSPSTCTQSSSLLKRHYGNHLITLKSYGIAFYSYLICHFSSLTKANRYNIFPHVLITVLRYASLFNISEGQLSIGMRCHRLPHVEEISALSFADAMSLVRQKRGLIDQNLGFVGQLKDFDDIFRHRGSSVNPSINSKVISPSICD